MKEPMLPVWSNMTDDEIFENLRRLREARFAAKDDRIRKRLVKQAEKAMKEAKARKPKMSEETMAMFDELFGED